MFGNVYRCKGYEFWWHMQVKNWSDATTTIKLCLRLMKCTCMHNKTSSIVTITTVSIWFCCTWGPSRDNLRICTWFSFSPTFLPLPCSVYPKLKIKSYMVGTIIPWHYRQSERTGHIRVKLFNTKQVSIRLITRQGTFCFPDQNPKTWSSYLKWIE